MKLLKCVSTLILSRVMLLVLSFTTILYVSINDINRELSILSIN